MKRVSEKRFLFAGVFVTASALLLFAGGEPSCPVDTEYQLEHSGENIQVVGIQLGRDSYGFAMVDTVKQTLWIYEINNRGPVHSRLQLLAARSWKYDRLLEQYNTAEPKPEQVRLLLEKLGQLPESVPEKSSGDDTVEATGPDD